MFQVVQREALTRLLGERGVFSKKELLGMVKVVDRKMKIRRGNHVNKPGRRIQNAR
jgi:hypothetical protein